MCMCVWVGGCRGVISLPGTALGLLTELPSGGLSPTMLGSWALRGGEYTGGLDPCSWSNFFGTLRCRSGAKSCGRGERRVHKG